MFHQFSQHELVDPKLYRPEKRTKKENKEFKLNLPEIHTKMINSIRRVALHFKKKKIERKLHLN